MFDAVLVAGLRELGKVAKANLRFHLAAGTPFCADQNWYVREDGAACLAALAWSKDPIQDLGGPVAMGAEVPPGLAAVYRIMAKGAGGWGDWWSAERAASADVLRESVEEALNRG